MKIYREIEQQSDEWFEVRKGKLTGSIIKKVLGLTAKRDPKGYTAAYQLLAEKHLNLEEEKDLNAYQVMERGNILESVAREKYEEITGFKIEEIGFVEKNDYLGLSPDGLINTNTESKAKYTRAIEIKCPLGANFMKYVIQNKIPDEYLGQVINNFLVIDDLLILDFVVYHPGASGKIPKLHIIRTTRNELSEQIEKARDELSQFKRNLDILEENLFTQSEKMLGQEIDINKFYQVPELAEILGLKRATVNKKCREGQIICSNSGTKKRGKFLIKGSDILDFINK